jgi:hypothetical protein
MKKIILHVGIHKTGTTSIQRTLKASSDILNRHGIHYLESIGEVNGNHGDLYAAFCSEPAAWGRYRRRGKSAASVAERVEETLQNVGDELGKVTAEVVIISSEHLCQLPEENLRRLQAWLSQFGTVHAVYYLRNIVSWMNSNSQQIAKGGLKAMPTRYEDAIDRMYDFPVNYLNVFGSEFVNFVKFEEAVRSGLCNSLLQLFGLPTLEQMNIVEIRFNESVSDQAVESFFILNRLRPRLEYQRTAILRSILERVPGKRYEAARLNSEELADYQSKMDELSKLIGKDMSYDLEFDGDDDLSDGPYILSPKAIDFLINELEKLMPGAKNAMAPFMVSNPPRVQQDIILRLHTLTCEGGVMRHLPSSPAA